MDLHPNVNDPVVLRDREDREYDTQVEDLGVGLLVVTQPKGLPEDAVFGPGAELTVAWTDEDGGTTVLPTRILAVHGDETKQLWSLAATAPAYKTQRRRHVRVEVEGPVTLRATANDDHEPVRGTLTDVSEGGVRCTVDAGAADGFLTASNEVVAEFRLGTVDFAIPGRAEFLRSTSKPAQFEYLVVVFDEPVPDVDVLAEQIQVVQDQPPADEDEG